MVPTRTDEAAWTTREILDTEDRLVRTAVLRRGDRAGVVDPASVTRALATLGSLTREQTRLVQRLTRSGAGVEVVEGAAGTGKTFALAAARHAWQTAGYQVIGCSLAARAALQLQEGSGIPSVTVDRLLRELDRSGPAALGSHHVVVVDEAAIVGTRQLAKLLDHAHTAHAKVVLVGDHHQLPEIDAGGAFAGLASRLGSIKLNENRRQHAEWERQALARLRAGATDRALHAYQHHGRVHLEPDLDTARHRLVSDWMQARRAGGSHAMLAQARRDVDELNHIAREHLRAERQLEPHDTVIDGKAFAVGDEILATRNAHDLEILNGTRATITRIDEHHGTIRARTPDGNTIEFPADYTRAGNLTHGYATTIHKAQGTTVQHSFVLVRDTIDREFAYSGLSRGSDSNSLYLADAGHRDEHHHAPELEPDPLERLSRGLHTSGAKTMARDLADGIGLER